MTQSARARAATGAHTPVQAQPPTTAARALPSLEWERRAWASGALAVAGVDEAGRGAWAGPLVAAAVVVPREPRARAALTRRLARLGITAHDSKQVRPQAREQLSVALGDLGWTTAVVQIDPAEIDAFGVGVANQRALQLAVERVAADHALIDAFRLPQLGCRSESIIRGDAQCLSIALASCLAKHSRDTLLHDLDARFPQYGFAAHKGYGTAAHQRALREHGPCAAHRHSYRPIAALVQA